MKTSLLKRYGPIALVVVWTVGCWAFFQLRYPYHFFYKEQNQLFLWTTDYLDTYTGPGWLARLMGDFLTQFYYYLYAGAIILTLVLLAFGFFVKCCCQRLGMGRWSYILAIAATTLEAWRHFYYAYPLSSTICLAGYAFALWCCLLHFKKRKWLSLVLMAMLAIPCWLFFGKPEKGKFASPEWGFERFLAVDNEYYWRHYDRVRQLVESDSERSPYSVFLYSLANAKQGILPDHLLQVTPIEMGTLWKIGPEAPLMEIKMINELYYVLGDVTYAERAAMMGNVFAPDNRNVRMVKRLAECNLISGDQPAAQKYLRILSKTLPYRHWAETAPAMKEYQEKAKFTNRKDTIRLGDFARTILLELLDSNPQNLTALDYLLCTDLQTLDLRSFKADYDRYCIAPNAPRLKPIYQQALLICLAASQASEDEMRQYIKDQQQLARFNAYNQVRGTAAISRFSDTYWYYYDKNYKKQKR